MTNHHPKPTPSYTIHRNLVKKFIEVNEYEPLVHFSM